MRRVLLFVLALGACDRCDHEHRIRTFDTRNLELLRYATLSFGRLTGSLGNLPCLPGRVRTEVAITDSHGRATLHGLMANRIPGRFQVRIVASKEQARAGTVSFQYVAELKSGDTKAAAAAPTARKRWLMVLAAVAGGAVAGVAATRGGGTASAPPAAPVPPAQPSLTVGVPSISVGKP